MKRLLTLAVVVATWTGAAGPSFAGTFGLCYSRKCGSCSFCVRPYNAFSPVASGNVDMSFFGPGVCPSCRGGGYGGYPLPPACWGGYGCPVGPVYDGPVGAIDFGYSGVPADCPSRGKLGLRGCGKFGGRLCASAAGLTPDRPVAPIIPPSTPPGPPPAPPVAPARNYCGIWFAPVQPMTQPGCSPMPWPAPKATLVQVAPGGPMGGPVMQPVGYQPLPYAAPGFQPVSYQGFYPGAGYQPAAWWPAQQSAPVWSPPAYWNAMGH